MVMQKPAVFISISSFSLTVQKPTPRFREAHYSAFGLLHECRVARDRQSTFDT